MYAWHKNRRHQIRQSEIVNVEAKIVVKTEKKTHKNGHMSNRKRQKTKKKLTTNNGK